MTRRLWPIATRALVLAISITSPAWMYAQSTNGATATKVSGSDSIFIRAHELAASGKTAEGRKLIDSLMITMRPGTSVYGDALYWRASVAATAADAERDYREIIVEYPLSVHSGDALLQLAQLEIARDDRAAATDHLRQFLRENSTSPARARTGLRLVRLLFEQSEPVQACGALTGVNAAIAAGDVELRNQADFFAQRCAAVAAAAQADSIARAAAIADSVKKAAAAEAHADSVRADSVRADSIRADSARAKSARARAKSKPSSATHTVKGKYAVQVAAYDTRLEADHLAEQLSARGLDAHVDGTKKPYRVRVGHYPTHAAATKAAAELKEAGVNGFVTSISQ